VVQVPQVIGQAADTPVRAQRLVVSLVATQLQYLEMVFPSFTIFSLSGVSTHGKVAAAVGAGVGAPVGAGVGVPVGAIGAAEGLGDGLMDSVGLPVG